MKNHQKSAKQADTSTQAVHRRQPMESDPRLTRGHVPAASIRGEGHMLSAPTSVEIPVSASTNRVRSETSTKMPTAASWLTL